MPLDSKYLSINEVLKLSGISRATLNRDIKNGKLKTVNFLRSVRILESDALKYAAEKKGSPRVIESKNKDKEG